MDDARRWAAVVRRDAAFDGHFVYCVKSTKIFCRPTCKARLARRMNVEFCDTPAQAEAAGYRPCKRCQPCLASYTPEADKIRKACDWLQALPQGGPLPGLERLAKEAGLTKHHFHRLFKRETGMTPREFALACRDRQGRNSVSSESEVVSPITPLVGTGEVPIALGSEDVDWSSFVAGPDPLGFDLIGYTMEDMITKDAPLDQIEVLIIYYSLVETTYGYLLIAFKGDQVCKLELGASEAELMASLEAAFSSLYYIHSHISLAGEVEALAYQQRVDAVVDALEHPSGKMLDVPLSLEMTSDEAAA